MLQLEEEERTSPTIIKVVGVGGAGMNAVNRMIHAELKGVDFIVINTDEQVLKKSAADERIAIGQKTTRGMGAGGDPDIGLKAAMEDRDRILQALKGADMIFITAGMGGGTGTGAAPIVADVARELGALTVGVVTMPFAMEGGKRQEAAGRGIDALRDKVDTLITIRNDSIFKVIDRATSVDVAFHMVDEILLNAVKGISDLINTAGLVNVDFADVRSIMGETGDAIMGAGEGVGENRVADAVNQAINNALLEDTSIEGAAALLINVCGGEDMSISDWKDVSELITRHVDPRANIIIGLTIDRALQERIRVTVIATGFRRRREEREELKKAAGDEGRQVWTRYGQQPQQPPSSSGRVARRAENVEAPAPAVNIRQEATDFDFSLQERARDAESRRDPRRDARPGNREAFTADEADFAARPAPRPGAPRRSGVEDEFEPLAGEDELPEHLRRSTARERSAPRRPLDPDDLEIPAYLRRRDR